MRILDYSAGYPGARAVRDAGHGGVIRYLRKEGTSRVRPITSAELADMRAHGLAVALVYQAVSTSRVTEGRAAGQHDARWALAQAAAIGAPEPRCVYFAVDFDAQPGAADEYFRGAADVLGVARVGGYGSWRVLTHLRGAGLIAWAWQCYAWSPGHNKDPNTYAAGAHLFQRLGQVTVGGTLVDINDVLKPDFGQLDHQEVNDMLASDPVRNALHNPADPKSKPIVDNFEMVTFWTNHYVNRIPTIEAKLDAMAGALSDDEANILVAIRAQGAGSGITPEQHADILRQQLPGAVLAALVELVELAKGAA